MPPAATPSASCSIAVTSRAAQHRDALVDEALFEEGLEPGLRDGDRARVAGPPGPAIQLDRKPGEMAAVLAARQRLAEQRLQQAAQVQHLGRTRLQGPRPRLRAAYKLLLQHHDRHAGQRELAGQHQAGGTGPDHDHLGVHRALVRIY